MIPNYHFGKSLKKYLEKHGITNVHVANLMGVSPPTFNSYFKAENPRKATQEKILKALGITLDVLLDIVQMQVSEPPVLYEKGMNLNGMVIVSQEEYEENQRMKKELDEVRSQLIKYQKKEIDELKESVLQGYSPA